MKKKFKLLLVLVIAVLTLSIVGYATWYITRDPKSVDGNVTAYAVDSDEITVELCNANGTTTGTPANEIVFGIPSGTPANDKWLRYDTGDAVENLIVHILVTTESTGTFTLGSELWKTIDGTPTEQHTNLFTGPTFAFVSGGTATATVEGTTLSVTAAGTVIISVTYAWKLGSNPYTFFYSKTKNAKLVTGDDLTLANAALGTSWATDTHTYKDFAEKYLTDLNTLCTGLTFKITVTDNHA